LKRIALGIQYDGAPWHGWQTQPSGKTVQDRLEDALHKFTLHPTPTICAGRTDTGVHALEQIVHFDTPLERPAFSWVRGVNAFLPPSIAVRWAIELACSPGDTESAASDPADHFHARFSAVSRTYHYLLYNHPVRSPLVVGKAGWAFRPLQLQSMQQAAADLVGTHDFSAFRSSECQARSPVRTMHSITIDKNGDVIVFSLTANAFLHHMVRNIVGALILTGHRESEPGWMRRLLETRDRTHAPPTFMPDGLYLARINYDTKWGLPQEKSTLPWIGQDSP
jgi:tRNA pseudouridine38-40 synthase